MRAEIRRTVVAAQCAFAKADRFTPPTSAKRMNKTIVDVTEILDRQKITGFNARLLLLTFLVTTTYGLAISPTILAGSDFLWGWGVSGAEYAVQLTLGLAAGFVIPLILGRLADCFGRR